jgi:hypothetical protein
VPDSFLGHLQRFCATNCLCCSSKCFWNLFEGKKTQSSWKTNEEPLNAIKEHIQNFPVFKSHYMGQVAQLVLWLATGWTIRGSNPDGGEIFRTSPDRPWGPPSLMYNGYRVFPRSRKQSGRDAGPLSHPKLSIFIAYQKCDRPVLNVGFHNFGTRQVDTYIWKDTIASRGSQEATP